MTAFSSSMLGRMFGFCEHVNKIPFSTKSVNFSERLAGMKVLTISKVVIQDSNILAQYIYVNDSATHQLRSRSSDASRIVRKSQLGIHIVRRNPYPSTLELDRPQHDRPVACVIAQQYSSATFVSLNIHPAQKNSVFEIYLTFWRRNYFFFILAHPVYKM